MSRGRIDLFKGIEILQGHLLVMIMVWVMGIGMGTTAAYDISAPLENVNR